MGTEQGEVAQSVSRMGLIASELTFPLVMVIDCLSVPLGELPHGPKLAAPSCPVRGILLAERDPELVVHSFLNLTPSARCIQSS